ncbi:hypothetical protein ACQP1O_17825 [Nocardia sp. CA-151230]|uniref:hypothetical protein n=1 Tax=Nocardia sp. CA-151230 TaxID=3239982 RepID=UPI003D92DC0D
MNPDPNSYIARLRIDPRYQQVAPQPPTARALVVGYRACFATDPKPATPVAAFAAITPPAATTVTAPCMALISVERATQVVRVRPDGSREIGWEDDYFPIVGDPGIRWCLLPVDLSPEGRFVIADGGWAAGGYQAVLTRSTIAHAPTAPTVVAVHNTDPRTGHTRW